MMEEVDHQSTHSHNHAQTTSIRIKVKDLPKLQCIELPCFVKTEKTVFELLGGEERVLTSLLTENPSLQLQFPGANPLSNGLQGRALTNKPGLLVKIVRRRRKQPLPSSSSSSSASAGNEEDVRYKVEVVGSIQRQITFNDPADYQFLPASKDIQDYRDFQLKPILEIVPQSFARMDYMKRQQFVQYTYDPRKIQTKGLQTTKTKKDAKDEHGSEEDEDDHDHDQAIDDDGDGENEKKRRQYSATILKFGEPIPATHSKGPFPPRWKNYPANYRGFKLLERIRKVLNLIPVINRQHLVDILGLGQRQHLFRECLHFAAYTFENGPFLRLYIRYGYDPTADPSSKIYQVITCRFTPEFLKEISDRAIERVGREHCNNQMVDLDRLVMTDAPKDFSHSFITKGLNARLPVMVFNSVLKHQVSIQIFQSGDVHVFEFIRKMKVLTQCNEQLGWFSPQSTEEFRRSMKAFISKRLDTFIAQSQITFQKSVDQIDEEEVDKNLAAMEKYLTGIELDELEEMRIDENTKWLKRYRDGINQYSTMNEIRKNAAITLGTSTTAATAPASSIRPDIIASAQTYGLDNSTKNRSVELQKTAQKLGQVYETGAFSILGDSSDSEADMY